MEQNNNILSAEGPLLDRINTYQREIAELDTGLLDQFELPNGTISYGYELTISKVKSWTDDLTSVLQDEEGKKRINNNISFLIQIINKGLYKRQTISTIEGTKRKQKLNEDVYEEFVKYLSMSLTVLKGYTSRHFSSIKSHNRLIK